MRPTPHILFVFPKNVRFPPTRGDSLRVEMIARYTVRSGIQASIFYLGEGISFMREGVEFHPVHGRIGADPSTSGKFSLLEVVRDFFQYVLTLGRFLRRREQREFAVYAHTPVGGFAGAIVKAMTGRPLIYDPHDWHYDSWAVFHRRLTPVMRSCAIIGYKTLAFLLPRVSDLVVCVSESMTQAVQGCDRKLLIPNIVEEIQYPRTPSQEEKGLVVFVGHVAAYQGVLNLIQAFSMVQRELDDASLLIVGDGEDLEAAKRLAKDLGLRNVAFTGAVSHERVPFYLRSASVCVAPFLPYPFVKTSCPIKLLEYVAMNKKIAVTDIPEFRTMLRGYTHAAFAFATPKSLAEAIVTLLNGPSCDNITTELRSITIQLKDFREGVAKLYEFLGVSGVSADREDTN